jgi:Flp pilus assembly protein TadD
MKTGQRSAAEALFHEGNRHLAEANLELAQSSFREALARVPEFSEAWANLGFLLDQKGELAQAEDCYRRSLQIAPDCTQVYLNLGALLTAQGRFEQAHEVCSKAISLSPEAPAGWSNLGVLYIGMKREAEAEFFLRKALELAPGFAKAQFNLGYLLLRQARFEDGWRSLESRDWYRGLTQHLTSPRWRGEALAGKSLLIGYEAGHGDVIQFCRYAKLLKRQGAAHITLLCHPALKTLLATLDGVDQVLAFDEDIPNSGWDFWTPLLSIPYYCQTRAESIPAELPYLHASPALVKKWRAFLPDPDGMLRVGLVWRGNPKFENDADRSLSSLNLLASLGAVPGVHFISLQKGAGEDEARCPPSGLELIHLGSQMEDFADAAAIIAQLDLVISVDTAMAHLAGALGKPCWLLLPDFMTDWRWQSERSDSPWYPGVMRLFRQPSRGDWTSVITQLGVALNSLRPTHSGLNASGGDHRS